MPSDPIPAIPWLEMETEDSSTVELVGDVRLVMVTLPIRQKVAPIRATSKQTCLGDILDISVAFNFKFKYKQRIPTHYLKMLPLVFLSPEKTREALTKNSKN